MRSSISQTITWYIGHLEAITAKVQPPTYPAPIQQIVCAESNSRGTSATSLMRKSCAFTFVLFYKEPFAQN